MSGSVVKDDPADSQAPHPASMYSFFPSSGDDRMRRPSTGGVSPQIAQLFAQQALLSGTQSSTYGGSLPSQGLTYNEMAPRFVLFDYN